MAPQQRRARSRRLACVAATLAAAAALTAVPGFAAGLGVAVVPGPPAPTPTSQAAGPEASRPPAALAPSPGQEAAPLPPLPAIASVPAVPAAPAASGEPSVPAVPGAPGVPAASGGAFVPAAPGPLASAVPPLPPVPASPSVLVPPAVPAPARNVPAFGAYLHYDTRGVSLMDEFSRWLGGADLRVGHTYLPGDRWSNIEGRPGFLEAWADWRNQREDRIFVLNVPMMERNEARVPDSAVRKLLRHAADGRFDHHFRALAERLVALRVPDTVIVLGWEMNGITYTHRCGPDPESWKKYWHRIVTAMRSVPGQKFRFDFAPSRGEDDIPWTECYPGDDVVDIIGMDSYDQPAGMSFDEQVKEPYGLRFHVDFAKQHGKPISYPEWGLFRNGDNPEYMRRMLAWMDEHRPLYNTLTDYCPHGVWQCDENSRASEVYRTLLTGRTDAPATPTTRPVTPPAPGPAPPPGTEPAPRQPADCMPLELGDRVEHWIGGELCVRIDWWSRLK
ncbi:glycosyl hydrolase [Streptomyces sp. NPDC052676]|uniref:glycoside hydrolase family 26 protein n=1 Tax=Streptomyces sp. NPDC052676 TaxID=3154953 RepID=UPI00341AF19D